MVDKNKIIDLKLKKIDIKLEKEKYLHKSIFSFIIALVVFVITSTAIADFYKQKIVDGFVLLFSINIILGIVALSIFAIGLPILAYFLSLGFMNIFIKSTNKIYDDRIKEIDRIINELSKKKS